MQSQKSSIVVKMSSNLIIIIIMKMVSVYLYILPRFSLVKVFVL